MKVSEAVLVAGILSSVSGSVALMASAFLTEASAGATVAAAAVDAPRSPADAFAPPGGRDGERRAGDVGGTGFAAR